MGNDTLDILDIGCGYGRDVFYLRNNLRRRVLGIDTSEKAIDIALSKAHEMKKEGVKFQHYNFTALGECEYDVIFTSHVYQLLRIDERKEFREIVMRMLKPNGVLFLSTLSVRDPVHYGRGLPITGEPNSFQEKVYLHLCTREELAQDFDFLSIEKLYEHEYDEPHATDETHHHILWMLTGKHVIPLRSTT